MSKTILIWAGSLRISASQHWRAFGRHDGRSSLIRGEIALAKTQVRRSWTTAGIGALLLAFFALYGLG